MAIISALSGVMPAQQRTGAVEISVVDQSGAAISGVQLTVTNTHTGLERNRVTGGLGTGRFSVLPAGVYRISAAKTGFQTSTRDGITVSVNEQPSVSFTLGIASAEESITITEDAPQINVFNATNGVVVNSREIRELPLNGRNYVQLGSLIPGVVETPLRFAVQSAAGHNGFSVNGQRTQSNNFLLDGVSNNDPMFNGYVVTPPPDALQEFKILTSNFSAEYGNNSGSVVNVITRPGANEVHGALWEFLRNDAFDARNFFSTSRPPLRRNQYGAMAGGPLRKNRSFVSGYFEGLRAREGVVLNSVVLSPAQRSGSLAGLAPAPRDPATNQPFAGGVIPAARISPVASKLLDQLVPLPNAAGNRYNESLSVATDSDQFGFRADHAFSASNSLFVRYSYAQSKRKNPLGAATFSPSGSSSIENDHSTVISDTHVFSPRLVNEFNVGFVRQFAKPDTWSGVDLSSLGFAYTPTEPSAKGLPNITLSGLFSIGDVAQSWTKLARNTYQIYDNLALVAGRHNLHFGFDLRMQQMYQVFPNRPNGDFTFSGALSSNTIADYLLGLPAQFRQGGGDPAKHFIGSTRAFYAQDDFKVTRRLTLNLGLRYDLPIPFYDKQDRMASFQPSRKSTVRPNAPVGLLYPGDAGVPRATIQTDANNFAPRFGFAYDLFGDGKTSMRGGYGIFYDAVPGLAVFQNINVAPFNRFVQVDIPPGFANPYANFSANPQTDPSRDFPCPCLNIGFSPDFRTPYSQHMNLGVQRQLSGNLVLEAGYAASLGRKLAGYLEINPAVPGPGATRTNTQQRRIYADFNLIRPTFSRFNSNYNALQLRLEKRFSKGLAFLAAYTWSKAIDYQSSVNLSGENRPQDAVSLRDVRGLAAFDVRHRFVTNYSYDLPWLKSSRGLVAKALGGWRLVGIVAAQSGGPLTASDSVDHSLRGLGADRPDQIENPNDGPKSSAQWFNTSAFARLPDVAGGQRSGTAGRNTIIGPGLVQTDLGLVKSFAITDRQSVQFRAEAFNAVNYTNFQNPGTSIAAPQTFGVIQGARDARIIQFALKYTY